MVLGSLWGEGQVIHLSNDVDRDQQAQKVRVVESVSGGWKVTFLPCEQMDEILYGTIWHLINPLPKTDDVVRCRTVTSRWNV